jgi:hypothetical protein
LPTSEPRLEGGDICTSKLQGDWLVTFHIFSFSFPAKHLAAEQSYPDASNHIDVHIKDIDKIEKKNFKEAARNRKYRRKEDPAFSADTISSPNEFRNPFQYGLYRLLTPDHRSVKDLSLTYLLGLEQYLKTNNPKAANKIESLSTWQAPAQPHQYYQEIPNNESIPSASSSDLSHQVSKPHSYETDLMEVDSNLFRMPPPLFLPGESMNAGVASPSFYIPSPHEDMTSASHFTAEPPEWQTFSNVPGPSPYGPEYADSQYSYQPDRHASMHADTATAFHSVPALPEYVVQADVFAPKPSERPAYGSGHVPLTYNQSLAGQHDDPYEQLQDESTNADNPPVSCFVSLFEKKDTFSFPDAFKWLTLERACCEVKKIIIKSEKARRKRLTVSTYAMDRLTPSDFKKHKVLSKITRNSNTKETISLTNHSNSSFKVILKNWTGHKSVDDLSPIQVSKIQNYLETENAIAAETIRHDTERTSQEKNKKRKT